MAVPDSFLPMAAENANLARYRSLDRQLQSQATHPQAVDRGRALQAKYKKYPWLSPGIATSYAKWETQLGKPIARDLARQTAKLYGKEGATNESVQDDLEKYIAKADFQSQIARGVERYYDGHDDFAPKGQKVPEGQDYSYRNLPRVMRRIVAKMDKERWESGDQANPIGDIFKTVGGVAGYIPGAKGVSRTLFTALESPYQEVQGAASKSITAGLGAVANVQTQPGAINPLEFGQQRPVLADLTRAGAAVESGQEALGISSGTHPNAAGLFGGVSTGAIALDKLLSGEDVDLGEGYFPGGEVRQQHNLAVRNIAALTYKDDGEKRAQEHFATPGRIFAAAVSEPGTKPFNALSGAVDAIAIIKADPTNIGLTAAAKLAKARKGFSPEAMEEAGGFVGKLRSFVDPPTARAWLANPNKGGALVDDLAYNLGPDDFFELGRRTGWRWDYDTMTGVLKADTPDAVRRILEPQLGISIAEQPALHSFAAGIRNVTGQHRLLSEIPGRKLWLTPDRLSGPNGSMRQLANHALGLGLDDQQVSRALFDIADSAGKVERSEAMLRYFDMEYTGLVNKGMPADRATQLTRFAREDLDGRARVYFDREISTGEYVPGLMIDGERYPLDTPFLASEHLGDLLTLPELTGRSGRNRMLAKYGRLMGVKGTGVGEREISRADEFIDVGDEFGPLDDVAGRIGLAHRVQQLAWDSNAWGIHVQNALWKPFALLRGAWTVRVIGEEQLRMAMSGFDSMFNHPIRYIGWQASKSRAAKGQDPALMEAMEWATEMNGFRNQMTDETFWQRTARSGQQPNATTGVFADTPLGRRIARNTATFTPAETRAYAQVWADKLINYHSDPVMSSLAEAMLDPNRGFVNAVDEIADEMMHGRLMGARADLATSPKYAEAGIDLTTPEGVQRYVEETFERLQTYTAQDGDLLRMVARGTYKPNVAKQASKTALKKGTRVDYDGMGGEIVEHHSGSGQVRVLFDDGTDEQVAATMLDFEGGERKVLTKSADNVNVDENFLRYLRSVDDEVKPGQITGTADQFGPDDRIGLDVVVKFMFANLMDRPTSYLNRSTVFMQERFNQLERLLPFMDDAARTKVLAEARTTLKGPLRKRYNQLVDTSARGKGATTANLTYDEADQIAKGHSLDKVRDLLYDVHRKNATFSALQLLAPFGEAWKEMLGSWGRILVERPQTVRKFQVGIEAARGANPFNLLPGATEEVYADQGFFFKDPEQDGAEMFVYPWSGQINEKLVGVPLPYTGRVQQLNMGFSLIPGVGPAFQIPAMHFLDRFADDKKWDPLRHLISPYGYPDVGEGNIIEQALFPSWIKTGMRALADPNSGTVDAKSLNSMVMNVYAYGTSTGEYNPNNEQQIVRDLDDAYKKARALLVIQTFAKGVLPAAPAVDFLAEDKNGKLVQMSVLAKALRNLRDDPKTAQQATQLFIERFGEYALYSTTPKSLSETFGAKYTKSGLDWERDNPDVVKAYPLTFSEYIPTPKKEEAFSFDAYLRAVTKGRSEPVQPKDWVLRSNNMLGDLWYDNIRINRYGLKEGEPGDRVTQIALAEERNGIAAGYPGWREMARNDSIISQAVDELYRASNDPRIKKANPKLYRDLNEYITERDWAIDEAAAQGSPGDFQNPGFAQANAYAYLREHLRKTALGLGKKNPQFRILWEDTFEREMRDDD